MLPLDCSLHVLKLLSNFSLIQSVVTLVTKYTFDIPLLINEFISLIELKRTTKQITVKSR